MDIGKNGNQIRLITHYTCIHLLIFCVILDTLAYCVEMVRVVSKYLSTDPHCHCVASTYFR